MRLHVVLPNETPETDAAELVSVAVEAERLGFAGVYLSDHLLPPEPYGSGPYNGVYEPLVTLAFIASATRRIRLGTSILVLAMRDPFLVAKQVATLDRLSGGRVTLGVGLGWSEAEFANVGARFAGRGARTDEALRLLRHLWTVGEGPFDGERFGFGTGYFAPRPTGGLKLLVGGTSEAALRRAARYADVWQSPPVPVADFTGMVATLRGHATGPIEVAGRLEWPALDPPLRDVLPDVLAEIDAWAAAGADELAVSFGPVEGCIERMGALAQARALDGVRA